MAKIVKKLKRVKTPSILSEVQVREVNVGSAVPFFRFVGVLACRNFR